MKKSVWFIAALLITYTAGAHHIIGGEMYYVSTGKSGNNYNYQVILKLYRGCEPVDKNHAALDPIVSYTIFDNDDNSIYSTITNIPLQGPRFPQKQRNDPCISNPPTICYQIGTYSTNVSLPVNEKGYTVTFQRCCRSDLLLNVYTKGSVGASYFTIIPGTGNGIPGDNSPIFNQEEAVLICSRGRVDYDYAATDPDGDELVYSFTNGFAGGNGRNNAPVPASPPPYPSLSYVSGFSPGSPLGPGVTIDPKTGEISGRTDLAEGTYDVSVMVQSYRNGKLIGTHLKDFQFEVHNCHREAVADIPLLFNDCKGYTINFPNNSTRDKTYLWNFGDGDTSSAYRPVHEYKDTGTYKIWLKVDPESSCGDSIGAEVKVYPKMDVRFSHSGNCLQFPTSFTDNSVFNEQDQISSWRWNFGESGSNGDTSSGPNPSYQFKNKGTFPVTLTLTTNYGCEQTDTQTLQIYDKPPLNITSDTILCYKDPLQLEAQSDLSGTYSWEPLYQITGDKTDAPLVHPQRDTTYRVTFTDNEGCVNTDSVHLRVKTKLLVNAGPDTTICQGDPVMLRASSDENYAFTWYDEAQNIVTRSRDAQPEITESERYTIRATLGSCQAEDQMVAKVVPYPEVSAAPDTGICYGDQVQLRGGGGAFYQWSPGIALSDSLIASPVASPVDSIQYTLTVTDTLGCPKPVSKTIAINVVPPVHAFAGNDTIITTGQIFQLHATGGNFYTWAPAFGLNDAGIPDPRVNWNKDIQYQVKVATGEGCYAYDTINIKYIKGPDIYVPNAFTPNGDGKNDTFRPVPVGVTEIAYFRVYNRWGQLVFETTQYMKGWDGNFKGKRADAGGYVWMVKGKDFSGKSIVKKGTVLLIR